MTSPSPRIFFSADHHFGHANIIRFTHRPFADVDEMTEGLIERWNARISPQDHVYYLGDLAFFTPKKLQPILERLNGYIFLIKGNHDQPAMACESRFEWIKDLYELKIPDEDALMDKKQRITLCHYAMRVWNKSHHGAWHLYGHSHGALPDLPDSLSFDVGVDCNDYAPISYEEVKARMSQKTWTPHPATSR
ncbi:phosphoesterase [Myxococcota bacterium]|nr:phosphoesterase [Myxococcota bacterium]MBU1897356.1 phosphoesterase [Myxococcota bacterium]